MVWERGFDLRSLSVFMAVADAGSLVSAAKNLKMTQAGVSQHISKIEATIGTRLLDRSLRPARLTPAGALLRERARHLLSLAQEARRSVTDIGNAPMPELRMAVVNSLAGVLMPDVYEQAQERFRFKNFSMSSGLTYDLNDALLNRDVDIVITSESMDNVSGLNRIDLLKEPFILVTPSGLKVDGNSLTELAQRLLFVRYHRHNFTGRLIEQHLRRLRIDLPHEVEFDSSWSIGSMVSAGRGWTITTPLCLLEGHVDPSKVDCRILPITQFTRKITMICRQGELSSLPQELAQIVSNILRNVLANQIASYGEWLTDECRVFPPGE